MSYIWFWCVWTSLASSSHFPPFLHSTATLSRSIWIYQQALHLIPFHFHHSIAITIIIEYSIGNVDFWWIILDCESLGLICTDEWWMAILCSSNQSRWHCLGVPWIDWNSIKSKPAIISVISIGYKMIQIVVDHCRINVECWISSVYSNRTNLDW